MENNENEVRHLNIKLDTSKIENKLAGLSIQVGKLKEELARINETINRTSNVVTETIKTAGVEISITLSNCMTESIAEVISNFQKAFEDKSRGETISEFGDKAFDVMLVLLQESLKMTGKADKSPPLLLPAPAKKTASPEGTSDPINGIANSTVGLAGMLPDLQSITEMKEAMSDLISTIKESVVQWGRQTLAKAKDRAEWLNTNLLQPVIDRENRRVGVSLAKGVV